MKKESRSRIEFGIKNFFSSKGAVVKQGVRITRALGWKPMGLRAITIKEEGAAPVFGLSRLLNFVAEWVC
ncbi:hypothetical protein VNO80_29439 [Phaseolus coccineus]|uniref:Uncharacterized protein n=1 Tax=Phaseolus coccineus TaxID=3886 RepID=A0AAN9LBB8_PHACN